MVIIVLYDFLEHKNRRTRGSTVHDLLMGMVRGQVWGDMAIFDIHAAIQHECLRVTAMFSRPGRIACAADIGCQDAGAICHSLASCETSSCIRKLSCANGRNEQAYSKGVCRSRRTKELTAAKLVITGAR